MDSKQPAPCVIQRGRMCDGKGLLYRVSKGPRQAQTKLFKRSLREENPNIRY